MYFFRLYRSYMLNGVAVFRSNVRHYIAYVAVYSLPHVELAVKFTRSPRPGQCDFINFQWIAVNLNANWLP